jgi:hypothetical protein
MTVENFSPPLKLQVIDDRTQEDDLLSSCFNQVLPVICIEYLEGHVTTFPYTYKGNTLILRVEGDQWSVWLDDCEQEYAKPQLHWRADDEGQRGPVYDALNRAVDDGRRQLTEATFERRDLCAEIHIDISSVSSHQHLAMLQARNDLLA